MRSYRGYLMAVLLLVGLGVAGCSQPPPSAPEPGFQPVLDMHELMVSVIDPATDVIWGAAGTIITADGAQDLAPTTAEGWLAVRNAAAVVTESGNLLLIPGRGPDEDDWREYSQAVISVGLEAMAAAEAKDADAVFDIGGKLYNVCVACHQAYAIEDAGDQP